MVLGGDGEKLGRALRGTCVPGARAVISGRLSYYEAHAETDEDDADDEAGVEGLREEEGAEEHSDGGDKVER
jgi:hypothetical protein